MNLTTVYASQGSISEGFNVAEWVQVGDPLVIDNVISAIIGVMSVIAGIWFLFLLVTGGLEIISAGDNKASLETARKKLFTGFIGLVIVIGGLFIADIIGTVMGLDLFNPGSMLNEIKPY